MYALPSPRQCPFSTLLYMKKLFTHIEQSRVGLYQSVLEESGIKTLIKNKNSPYKVEWPELWVVNDAEYEQAIKLFKELDTALNETIESWTCSQCGEDVEGAVHCFLPLCPER